MCSPQLVWLLLLTLHVFHKPQAHSTVVDLDTAPDHFHGQLGMVRAHLKEEMRQLKAHQDEINNGQECRTQLAALTDRHNHLVAEFQENIATLTAKLDGLRDALNQLEATGSERTNDGSNRRVRSAREEGPATKSKSSREGSAWSQLKISPNELGSIEWGHQMISIYGHSSNRHPSIPHSSKRFYFAPIALLDRQSVTSSFNSNTQRPELRFRVEMWNDAVKKQVLRFTSELINQTLTDDQVDVLPVDQMSLYSANPQRVYHTPSIWKEYNGQQSVEFLLVCYQTSQCDKLADEVKQNPGHQLRNLKLQMGLTSERLKRRDTSITIDQTVHGDLITTSLIAADDEDKLIGHLVDYVKTATFDDKQMMSPDSEAEIYSLVRRLMNTSYMSLPVEEDGGSRNVFALYSGQDSSGDGTVIGPASQDERTSAKALAKVNLAWLNDASNTNKKNRKIRVSYKTSMLTVDVEMEHQLIDDITSEEKLFEPQSKTGLRRSRDCSDPTSNGPKSCWDLHCLGHTSSGFYMVKGDGKIEGVYCYFPSVWPAVMLDVQVYGLQRSVGRVDVQSHPVRFYVQRTSSYSTNNTILPFDVARINEGEAFDLASGVFTAPVPGTYHFSLAGIKDWAKDPLIIALQLNGVNVGYARGTGIEGFFPYGLESTLKLTAGDRINLFIKSGVVFDNVNHFTHFTGWLMQEHVQHVFP